MGLSQRVAIIGTGIAGSTAAYCLAQSSSHRITVYEQSLRPGGHSSTLDIDYAGKPLAVDTGFIVYNEINYPNLTALFRHLDVATESSDMSFALSLDRGRFEWSGQETSVARGLFAQKRNLLSPGFLMFLAELARFHKQAKTDRQAGSVPSVTLRDYVQGRGYSRRLLDDYLAPMGAAIWSSSTASILDFPARSFIDFFDNHHLLQWGRPRWRTVTGGSRRYVDKMVAAYRSRLRLGTAVVGVARLSSGVEITDSEGRSDRYDNVIIATHAPQALALLRDPSQRERELLGALRTTPNSVFLHRDARLMPRRRAAWASWNVLRHGDSFGSPVAVTYWMNRLQNIDPSCPLFVSLNPPFEPRPDTIFARLSYDHPQFDAAAIAAQRELDDIQAVNKTFYCGAWTRFGFHEDGLVSGMRAAQALGAAVPWQQKEAQWPIAAE
jgi:predicted NAD/FAD-binding protein